MKKLRSFPAPRYVLWFFALLFAGSMQGCRFYYKVQTVKNVTPQNICTYDSVHKYLIVHQGDSAWHFLVTAISGDHLSGNLSMLPENRWKFKTTKAKGGNRYIRNKKPHETYVLEEVHLYMRDTISPVKIENSRLDIACSAIARAEIYKKAKGRTTASWLLPGLGLPLLAAGIVGIIIAADINHNGLMGGGGFSL